MRYVLMLPIMIYRKLISPLFPSRCKYYPSCSEYSLTAYRKHGAIKGTVLSVWRLLRCNPWSLGGIDHVPEEFHLFKRRKKHKSSSKESIKKKQGKTCGDKD